MWITSVLCRVRSPGAGQRIERWREAGTPEVGISCDRGRALAREHADPRSAASAGGHHPLPKASVVLEDVQAGEPSLPRVAPYVLPARPGCLRESDGQISLVSGAGTPDGRGPGSSHGGRCTCPPRRRRSGWPRIFGPTFLDRARWPALGQINVMDGECTGWDDRPVASMPAGRLYGPVPGA